MAGSKCPMDRIPAIFNVILYVVITVSIIQHCRQFESGVHDHERNTRAAIERAMEAHEKGKVFLRRTLVKHRKEEILAGKRHRQHLEARIKAILSLKRNIDSSQATIQAQQVLKHEWSKKQKELEKRERERILSEGGNPEEVFLMRKRVSEFEREQKKFKARQNERQLEIVTKLLEEEKKLKRLEKERSKSHKHGRQKSKPHLPKGDLCADKKKKSEVIHKQSGAGERGADPLLKVTFEEGDEDKQLRKDLSSDEDPGMEMVDAGELDQLDGESLLEPEIRGHWETAPVVSQKSDGASQPQDEGAGKREGEGVKRERSKAEVEMMQRAMDKLKKSAIIKQVAGGKEFKVCTRIS